MSHPSSPSVGRTLLPRTARRFVVPAAAILALTAPALADAQDELGPAAQPPPTLEVDAPKRSEYVPATEVSAFVDGCWTGRAYADDRFTCVDLTLTLWRGGKLVAQRVSGFFTPAKHRGAAGALVDWKCSGSRSYQYRITYANKSFAPDGVPYVTSRSGSFTTPRCRRPVARRVDRQTASARAFMLNRDYYPGEFISSVQCAASTTVRGKASKWTCRTTHNNSYRECTDVDALAFTGVSKWGERKRSYEADSVDKQCRYF